MVSTKGQEHVQEQLSHSTTKNINVTMWCWSEHCHFFCGCFMVSEAQAETFSWERARRGSGKQKKKKALLAEREWKKKLLSAENGIYVTLSGHKRIHTGLRPGWMFWSRHFDLASFHHRLKSAYTLKVTKTVWEAESRSANSWDDLGLW